MFRLQPLSNENQNLPYYYRMYRNQQTPPPCQLLTLPPLAFRTPPPSLSPATVTPDSSDALSFTLSPYGTEHARDPGQDGYRSETRHRGTAPHDERVDRFWQHRTIEAYFQLPLGGSSVAPPPLQCT